MPQTKAEVYARIISTGVAADFHVVPEYRIKPALETRKREVDLAWCIANPAAPDGRPWLPVGVFEIEGHDVELRRKGSFRGIEKDADSLLAAGKFLHAHTGLSVMPAAAVILFQLDANGAVHNSPMVAAAVEDHRSRFGRHAAQLCELHLRQLPSDARGLGPKCVILDDDLPAELERLVAQARAVQAAILLP